MLPYTELFHALVPELEKYVKTTMGAKGPTDNLAASTTDLVGRFNHAKDGFMDMFGVTEKKSYLHRAICRVDLLLPATQLQI